MPSIPLSEDEVLALRDYVLLAEPDWHADSSSPLPIQPLSRPVTYAEVEERVFGRICVHCHMNPDQNQGRAGPGNAGGFGWPATGIELETRAGILSVLDRIPAALDRRRTEAPRDVVAPGTQPATLHRPKQPGMPMGQPPLSDDDIALVLAWIQQGAPE